MKKAHKNKRQESIKALLRQIGQTRNEHKNNGKVYKKQHDKDRRDLRKKGMDYYDRLEQAERDFDRNQQNSP